MRVGIFLVLYLHLAIILGTINSIAIPNSFPDALQTPNQVAGVPYIKLSSDAIEVGSNLIIKYGVRNEINDDILLGGHSYNLTLQKLKASGAEMNNNETLISGITTTNESEYIFNAYNSNPDLRYSEGNYTLTFEVNLSSSGELLRTQHVFQVIPSVDANVQFSITQLNRTGYKLNRTEHLQVMVENIGNSNAFSVVIILQNIEQPVGLLNFTSAIKYDVMYPQTNLYLLFVIRPQRFGIGQINFRLDYENSASLQKSEFLTVDISIVPETSVNLSLSKTIQRGNLTDLSILITNHDTIFSSTSHKIKLTIDATKIIYIPYSQEFQLKDMLNITRNGNVIDIGTDKIGISIIYVDEDNVGEFRIHRIDLEIEILPSEIVIPTSTAEFPIYFYLTLSLLMLAFILLLLLGFVFAKLYSQKSARDILNNVLNKKINYPSRKIIVDCANVAWDDPSPQDKANLQNLLLAVDSLKVAGFTEIKCIADASLRYQVRSIEEFDKADKKQIFKVLPAKVSADHFILRLSQETKALILSNDLFKEFRAEFTWIDKRRVPFSIIDGKLFLHPISKINSIQN